MSFNGVALTDLTVLAAEESGELSPYVVGGATLVVFLLLLVGLFAFGKGRQHS